MWDDDCHSVVEEDEGLSPPPTLCLPYPTLSPPHGAPHSPAQPAIGSLSAALALGAPWSPRRRARLSAFHARTYQLYNTRCTLQMCVTRAALVLPTFLSRRWRVSHAVRPLEVGF